jgi:hypothetical protein
MLVSLQSACGFADGPLQRIKDKGQQHLPSVYAASEGLSVLVLDCRTSAISQT